MKFTCCDDLKTEEKILATEGVLGVVSGLTMLAHPQTAHVRNPSLPTRCDVLLSVLVLSGTWWKVTF